MSGVGSLFTAQRHDASCSGLAVGALHSKPWTERSTHVSGHSSEGRCGHLYARLNAWLLQHLPEV